MTREEAIHRLKNTAWLGTNKDREETEQAVDMAIEALTRSKGEWVLSDNPNILYECSNCGHGFPHKRNGKSTVFYFQNFCPHCGADMRGEE